VSVPRRITYVVPWCAPPLAIATGARRLSDRALWPRGDPTLLMRVLHGAGAFGILAPAVLEQRPLAALKAEWGTEAACADVARCPIHGQGQAS